MQDLKYIEVETGQNPIASVIWLHGLGASGHDFEPIVPELRLPEELPVRFVFPHAPQIPVTVNGGFVMPAWYDILDMDIDRKIDEPQLLASAQAVTQLIEREIERGIDSSRIILAGFSQGGAVAYQVALSYGKPLAGLLALSTYFPTSNSLSLAQPNSALPIEVMHGHLDSVVLPALADKAVKDLQKLGLQPRLRMYQVDHGVCHEEICDISEWFQQVL